jgi:hypothetical protein
MKRNGRPENQEFPPDENLFIRFNAFMVDIDVGGQVFFNFSTDQSCNREWPDGEPGDVLFSEEGKFNGWGVLTFPVEDIRSPMDRSGEKDPKGKPTKNPNVEFAPQHEPLGENYYHSVIAAFRLTEPKKRINKLSDPMKTWFKIEMARVLSKEGNILRLPE